VGEAAKDATPLELRATRRPAARYGTSHADNWGVAVIDQPVFERFLPSHPASETGFLLMWLRAAAC